MTVSSPKTSRIPRRILVAFGIGAVLGAAGYVFGRSVLPQLIGPDALEGVELRWSDAMAALTGVALRVGAAAVILISFDLRRLAQMYGMEEPASAEEGRQARLQAAVMGFSGFILLLPMVFAVIGLAPAMAKTRASPAATPTAPWARLETEAFRRLARVRGVSFV